MIQLTSEALSATIDPGRGADVLSLVDRGSGIDVLFRVPWRERADNIRGGERPTMSEPVAAWLEQYRGGWQTLFPSAGAPRRVHGAPVGFHGEGSAAAWTVDEVTASTAQLHLELFSVPVRIDRRVQIAKSSITVVDRLTNLSATALHVDYSHHPAFGGEFLNGECIIQTGATRYTGDAEGPGLVEPDSEHGWPIVTAQNGEAVDMRLVPGPDARTARFGWLHDFTESWASISNPELGLTVRVDWDGNALPYAWFWLELNGTEEFPWFGRARVVAIEPASTPTSGPKRESALRLKPLGHEVISVTISLSEGNE